MVKWNGIDFKDKGIIVEKTPSISKGKKDIERNVICLDTFYGEPYVDHVGEFANEDKFFDKVFNDVFKFNELFNGHVVAKFTLNKVEKIPFLRLILRSVWLTIDYERNLETYAKG